MFGVHQRRGPADRRVLRRPPQLAVGVLHQPAARHRRARRHRRGAALADLPGGQHRIDYLGTALLSAAVTCLVLLTTWGGTQYAWTFAHDPRARRSARVVAVALFIVVERRAAEPIIPLSLFRGRVFAVVQRGRASSSASRCSARSPTCRSTSRSCAARRPDRPGLQLLPLMAGVLAMSIGSGQLISRTGRYRLFPIVGTAADHARPCSCCRGWAPTPRPARLALHARARRSDSGLVMQVLVLAVQNAVPTATARHRDLGRHVLPLDRRLHRRRRCSARSSTPASPTTSPPSPPGPRLSGGTATLTPTLVAQLPAEVRTGVVTAFSDALSVVFLAAIPFAALAFALSWALPEVPLRSRAAPLDAVAETFGMVRTAAAGVLEETQARVQAAQTALDRLDDIAARNGLAPADVRAAAQAVHRPHRRPGRAHPVRRRHRRPAQRPRRRPTRLPAGLATRPRSPAGRPQAHPTSTPNPLPDGAHDLRGRMRREATTRLRGARAALARLDQLAPASGVPTTRSPPSARIFATRLAHLETTIDRARARADEGAYPVAFWRVAAELLATERQALARLTGSAPPSPAAPTTTWPPSKTNWWARPRQRTGPRPDRHGAGSRPETARVILRMRRPHHPPGHGLPWPMRDGRRAVWRAADQVAGGEPPTARATRREGARGAPASRS